MTDTNITATLLRRKLKDALKQVEAGAGNVIITRHNKVVAALVSGADYKTLQALSKTIVVPTAKTETTATDDIGTVVTMPATASPSGFLG